MKLLFNPKLFTSVLTFLADVLATAGYFLLWQG